LAEAEPESLEWIDYPYIAAGAMTELVGKAKLSGKTIFVTHLVGAVLAASLFLATRPWRPALCI